MASLLDDLNRRNQVSESGVPTTDPNYMLPSEAASQPARRGIYPDNGPVGTVATAASVPVAGALGVYAAKNPVAIPGMIGKFGANVARVGAGLNQLFQGGANLLGEGDPNEGTLKSIARTVTGAAALAPNPFLKTAGTIGSAALSANDVGIPLSIFNPWDFSASKIESIRNWMGGKGPQPLAPPAPQPSQPNLPLPPVAQVTVRPGQPPEAEPAAAPPGVVTTAARRTPAPKVDSAARTEEMARLNQSADQELRNAGMDQLVQSILAREAQQPSSLPAQGGIARIGTQYDAKGEAPVAGYVLPSRAAQEGDMAPVEVLRYGQQRSIATPTDTPSGPVMVERRAGAPSLEGFEPAQIAAYVAQLSQSNDPRDQRLLDTLLKEGVSRANNQTTTAGGITQQTIAGDTQRAVAGTQAASAGNVANTNLEGVKYTADKPQIVSSDNLVGYDSMGNPVYKRQQVVVDRNGNVIANPAANAQPAMPIKPGQKPARVLTPQQLREFEADKERYPTREILDKFLEAKNLKRPS